MTSLHHYFFLYLHGLIPVVSMHLLFTNELTVALLNGLLTVSKFFAASIKK